MQSGVPDIPATGRQRKDVVGSADYFDRYFHLGLGPYDFPDSAVREAFLEVLGPGPGPAWAELVSFLPTDAGLVLRKVHGLVQKERRGAERILPALCELAGHIPPASDLLDHAEHIVQSMVAELLTDVASGSVQEFVEDLARLSSVRFVADSTVWGLEWLAEEGKTPAASFNDICNAVAQLVTDELARQATLHPRDVEDVFNLLSAWGTLEPTAPRTEWLLRQLGEGGAWAPADFAALLVPVPTVTSSARPDPHQQLGNFNFEPLNELLGVETLVELIGDPATEPVYEVLKPAPDDRTFEARRARALHALRSSATR